MDTADYQEFMKFMEFKRMAAAEPPPSPPPEKAAAPQAAAVPAFGGGWVGLGGGGGGALFKIDWNRQMNNLMQMKPWRSDRFSAHPNLFEFFSDLYKEFPERFRLIGEIHAADDGRNYFSFLYEKPGVPCGRVTFHVYGHLSSTKFTYESVDIRIGKTEDYPNAARFNTAPRA